MANPEQLEKLKQGVTIWNKWREENSKVKVNLSGANLSFSNLSGANLVGVNFSQTDLSFADLSEADLSFSNLSGANLVGVNFNEVHLSKANLTAANLTEAKLIKANLLEANLQSANLQSAHLWETSLNGANLSQANLTEANLSFEDLSQTNLTEANLHHAHLIKTNLRQTDLRRANLTGANLTEANLTEANLRQANLVKTNLEKANLKLAQALNTNFTNANVTGACIENWKINPGTQLDQIICHYIYLRNETLNQSSNPDLFAERRPYDLNSNFAPGEFTELFQKTLETVDLVFFNGIDWKAFIVSLKKLQQEYGQEKLNLQGIEKKSGETLIVHLAVTPDINKAEIETATKQLYETELRAFNLETQYLRELNNSEFPDATSQQQDVCDSLFWITSFLKETVCA
ncbi:MAG: pentapeptide repeat-containing protein [Xenococcus sp. (in: cyanobacteria)]